ncbi:hypothetical protein H7827_06860 [Streptomyces sp. JH002]|uniref:hypothetical protein n=1 Tax=Streptomyces sp. JH002 TaxID=2763259 RepID=UPI003D80553B
MPSEPSEDISAPDDAGNARHAAPRKRLRQRFRMPISLAAMPSAALLGMGLTSSLAKADPQPENPFSGTACVELPERQVTEVQDPPAPEPQEPPAAPDTTAAGENENEDGDADEDADAVEEDGDGEIAERQGAVTDPGTDQGAAADPGSAADPDPEPDPGPEPDPDPEPEPEPDPQEPQRPEYNPLDPLGLGPALDQLGRDIVDFFTPGAGKQPPQEPEEEPEPGGGEQEPPETEESDASQDSDRPQNRARDPKEEAGTVELSPEPPDEPDEPEEDPQDDAAREPAEEPAGGAPPDPEEEPPPAEPEREVVHDPAAEEEKPGLPCPVELRVPGTDERTPVVIADNPWYLEASSLTLRGLEYHGVVNVTTANGSVKQALKFTAREVDIGDLHQIVDGADGLRHHVATAPGSTSTFRGGTVTMYTEHLKGLLFGVIPVDYDAEHQPPLDIPYAHFTGVSITQAAQFGGTLTMTGMRQYMTGG